MEKQADGLTDTSRLVDGVPTSLKSLGYVDLGIDEGWEDCGAGFNHTQHTAYGWPVVDTTKFPDLNATVQYIHQAGLKAGFYFNGCACGEPVEKLINYEGDVAEATATNFDSFKLDSCGAQKNLTLYYNLANASRPRHYWIENCHQGGDPPRSDGYCPYHTFRVSGDIINLFDRVLSNLQHSRPFLSVDPTLGTSLSRPGCWSYPDMLEVGRMPGEVGFDGETLATPAAESRTHFGAWAVTSSPLVLGLSLSLDDPVAQKAVDAVWDVITNKEVIAVSQIWAGLPGALVREWQAFSVPTLVQAQCPTPTTKVSAAHTWTFVGSALAAGDDLHSGVYTLADAEAYCGALDNCVGFTYKGTSLTPPAGATIFFKSAQNPNSDSSWSAYLRDYAPNANLTHW
jgi:hypothetical protein